jgi:hypothetical protein
LLNNQGFKLPTNIPVGNYQLWTDGSNGEEGDGNEQSSASEVSLYGFMPFVWW